MHLAPDRPHGEGAKTPNRLSPAGFMLAWARVFLPISLGDVAIVYSYVPIVPRSLRQDVVYNIAPCTVRVLYFAVHLDAHHLVHAHVSVKWR